MEHLNELTDRWLFEHYVDQMYRYEFTVTYNPRFIYSVEYANSMTDYVIKDIVQLGERASTNKRTKQVYKFYFNYVIEKHENGMPHIHGTLFTHVEVRPCTLHNWEKSFYRKYGKTMVWATGLEDKVHKNDHFEGTWQDYLHKEGEPMYFEYEPQLIDLTEKRIKEFKDKRSKDSGYESDSTTTIMDDYPELLGVLEL